MAIKNESVISYKDKNYEQKKHIYDLIHQIFHDIVYDVVHGGHSWNLPVDEIKGVTMRFIGEENLGLTYHHYEVTTIEGLARTEDRGKEFLDMIVDKIKQRFKEKTGKNLRLEKEKDGDYTSLEKASRIQADTSWMLGSSRYGYGARPVGRYLVRDSCVYKFDAAI